MSTNKKRVHKRPACETMRDFLMDQWQTLTQNLSSLSRVFSHRAHSVTRTSRSTATPPNFPLFDLPRKGGKNLYFAESFLPGDHWCKRKFAWRIKEVLAVCPPLRLSRLPCVWRANAENSGLQWPGAWSTREVLGHADKTYRNKKSPFSFAAMRYCVSSP